MLMKSARHGGARKVPLTNKNHNVIANLQERLGLEFNKAVRALDERIAALQRENSSQGLLKSGNTLGGIRDLCRDMITRLSETYAADVTRVVNEQILTNDNNLAENLHDIFTKTVHAKFHNVASDRISLAVQLVDRNDLADRLMAEITESENQASQELLAAIKAQELILSSQTERLSNSRKFQVFIALLAIVAGIIIALMS